MRSGTETRPRRAAARRLGGTLVTDGARLIAVFAWLVIFPGAALSLTLMCFNFLGDGLRDALDPQDKRDVA